MTDPEDDFVTCEECGDRVLAMVELRNPDTEADVLCARCARDVDTGVVDEGGEA